jgi:Sigma-70 region 2
MADIDERFAAYVRDRGPHHLRVAVLLTGDWHAAEDLVQASLVKLYRAWPKLRLDGDPDAYLRRIMVNTQRSWWRARWRRETPTDELPDTEVGGYTYLYIPLPASHPGRHWERIPTASLAHLPTIGSFAAATPQQMLAEIKKAGTVTVAGPASGPGWTGTRYAFTASPGPGSGVKLTGTVTVDGQGRARALILTTRFTSAVNVFVMTQALTFSDFGAPVTVTAPPADQTFAGP